MSLPAQFAKGALYPPMSEPASPATSYVHVFQNDGTGSDYNYKAKFSDDDVVTIATNP